MERAGICGFILDIDNTLAVPDKRDIPDDIAAWLNKQKADGVPMVLLSNNSAERIASFAEHTGLPFVAKGGKPGAKGYRKAAEKLGLPLYQCAAVGDQLFTDVWGGNRAGAVTVLTEPFYEDQTKFIVFKRKLERPLLKKYRKQQKEV